MTLEYATIKSHFHGGGIYKKHHTFEAACKEAEKWTVEPGLAVACLGKDGKYYKQDYQKDPGSGGGFALIWEDDNPIPTIQDHPHPTARDYILFDSDFE